MKKCFSRILAVLMLLCMLTPAAVADTKIRVQVDATYLYDQARSMLTLINKLRTGKDAWVYNEKNKKVSVKGLGKLTYDKNLEKVAMQRAVELAVYFSHTRPDGTQWKTAFPSNVTFRGENVAVGYGSAQGAFNAFCETNMPYAGQGHRRNMLTKEFTRVGIGAVKVGNLIFWVQEFGNKAANSPGKSVPSNVLTASLNTIGSKSLRTASSALTIAKGSSVALPNVVVVSNTNIQSNVLNIKWTSSKKAVTVKSTKLVGAAVGSSKLSTKVGSTKLSMTAKVVAKVTKTEDIDEPQTPKGPAELDTFLLPDEGAVTDAEVFEMPEEDVIDETEATDPAPQEEPAESTDPVPEEEPEVPAAPEA